MFVGFVILLAATLLLFYAFVSTVQDIRTKGTGPHMRRSVRATFGAVGLVWFVLFILAGAFLVGDLSLDYVWRHVDRRYAWYQRLSGLWIGREGSLLLWTGFTLAIWAIEELRHKLAAGRDVHRAAWAAASADARASDLKRVDDGAVARAEHVRRWARATMLALGTLMLGTVLLSDLFMASDPLKLLGDPNGRGVNPQLIIAFNAIHPPIVFLGYALTALPTAFAVGHLVTGHASWLGPARRWAHLAFMFLTLGVGLGGLWAYIALGWGGYWAWDPVEVGSIVPWLVITTFLHAAYRADSKGEFSVAAPALAFLALPAAILSTFIVRAGGVWVSVHSFLGPGAADSAWARYLEAFAAQLEVKLYTVLLAAAIIGFAVLLMRHVKRLEEGMRDKEASAAVASSSSRASADATLEVPSSEAVVTKSSASARDQPALWDALLAMVTLRNGFLVGVSLLALLTTVMVTVLFLGVNGFSSDAVRSQVYTERTGPIALAAILVMGFAIGRGMTARGPLLALLSGILVVGAAAMLVFPDNKALSMAVPLVVGVATLAFARIILAWRRMNRSGAIRFSGIHLVHLGFAVVLLGHGFVSTFETFEEPVELTEGSTRTVGAYLLRLDKLDATDTDGNGRLDRVIAHLQVWRHGENLGVVTTGFQYYEFQSHYKPIVGLDRSLEQDVYLAPQALRDPSQGWLFGNLPLPEQNGFEARQVDAFSVQVSTLPFLNLVWGGALLMVLGGAMVSFSSWTAHGPSRRTSGHPAPEPDVAALA